MVLLRNRGNGNCSRRSLPPARGAGDRKALVPQASKAGHQLSPVRAQRFGGQGRGLATAVGLAEQVKANLVQEKKIRGGQETLLGGQTANDQVRVFGVDGKELSAGLQGSVTGLDDHLRGGQVRADQNVEV